jgi:hypothetical protein
MEEIDTQLSTLLQLSNVFDNTLFDYLCEEYNEINKRLEDKGGLKLVLIRSPILFTYLVISSEEGKLLLYSVRKSQDVHQFDEENFISDVINKILHWLWIRLATTN